MRAARPTKQPFFLRRRPAAVELGDRLSDVELRDFLALGFEELKQLRERGGDAILSQQTHLLETDVAVGIGKALQEVSSDLSLQIGVRFDLLLEQGDDTQQVEPVLAREGARTARPRDRPGSVRVRLACTRPALRSGKFGLCQQGFDRASDGCLRRRLATNQARDQSAQANLRIRLRCRGFEPVGSPIMRQRRHRRITNQPLRIAEPFDQRRNRCRRTKPRQGFRRATTDKHVFVGEQIQQQTQFSLSHADARQPGCLRANLGVRIPGECRDEGVVQACKVLRQQAKGAEAFGQRIPGIQENSLQSGLDVYFLRVPNDPLALPAPFGSGLRQAQQLVEPFLRFRGSPNRNNRWRDTGGRGICVGMENSPNTLIVIGGKQTPIRRHRHINERKVDWLAIGVARTRLGSRQRFHRCLPPCTVSFQKEHNQPPRRCVLVIRFLFPTIVANDECIAILFRKLVVLVKHAPVRRTAAHVKNSRQTINVVRRIRADLLPALVAADGPLIEPHGSIPRQPDVPFHVAVEAEQLAQIIHAEVGRIAAARGNALPFRAVRRDAKHRRLAFEQHRRSVLRDVLAVFDARAVSGHEIKPAVVPAKNRVGIVVAAGVEFVSNPAFVNEFLAGSIAFKDLQSVSTDGIKLVIVNQQPLRPAPAEAGCDNLKGIEHAIAVFVDESSHRIPVADQQASLPIERQRVAAAGNLRSCGAVDVKARWQFKAVGQVLRRVVCLRRGRQHEERRQCKERGDAAR